MWRGGNGRRSHTAVTSAVGDARWSWGGWGKRLVLGHDGDFLHMGSLPSEGRQSSADHVDHYKQVSVTSQPIENINIKEVKKK